MVKVLKGKTLQPRIFCPVRLSFRVEGEIKSVADKQKVRVHQYQTELTRSLKGLKWKRKGYNRVNF